MSDVYEIIEKLSREVCELHSDNQRLRARIEVLERDVRLPRPPEELVGALNDRIHPASGRLLNATPIHAKLKEAKP
jgi:hypothetical protein